MTKKERDKLETVVRGIFDAYDLIEKYRAAEQALNDGNQCCTGTVFYEAIEQ